MVAEKNCRKTFYIHIQHKLTIESQKQGILKVAKNFITYKGFSIKSTADFPSEIMKTRKQ